MRARHIMWGISLASLTGSASYLFVYLYRWEWNRAQIAGTLLIVSEVALLGTIVLSRLNRPDTGAADGGPEYVAAEMLARTRPTGRDTFAWLRPDHNSLGVFIPVLIGAGAVISAIAWIVEWVARHLARPTMERRLAATMTDMIYPSAPLVDLTVLPVSDTDLLTGPHPHTR